MNDYRDNFREVRRDVFWSAPRIFLVLVVAMAMLYSLGFLATVPILEKLDAQTRELSLLRQQLAMMQPKPQTTAAKVVAHVTVDHTGSVESIYSVKR